MRKNLDFHNEKWGFLAETKEKAAKAGKDPETNLHHNGLEEYLAVIFPKTDDWIHDRIVPNNIGRRKRPDYRSESLKLIVEFDGIYHYADPERIIEDQNSNAFYDTLGYKVVRIPFFIQLTNKAVLQLFNVDVKAPLFNGNIPSLGKGANPARIRGAGLYRMAKEFLLFPEQYQVNIDYLKSFDSDEDYDVVCGALALEAMYTHLKTIRHI